MPGLAGLISSTAEPTLFSAMQTSLNHRDYHVAQFIRDGIHLTHLSHPNSVQKIKHSSDGNLTVGFHGQLFSIAGSTVTDFSESGAVFLDLIKDNGFEVLNKINGQFCAFVQDHSTHTSYLISDRFNTQPVYYTIHNQRLLFAPEVKALIKDSFVRRIDYHAIAELFSFGYVHGNKTLFEGVYRLPPATILKFHSGNISLSEYWSFSYSEDVYKKQKRDSGKSKLLAQELKNIFITATKRQDVDSGKLLIPLSGGLDSRYAAALYHHIGKENVSVYTMGPDKSEDQLYARQVASKLNFDHHKFEIKPNDVWAASGLFSYVSDGMSNISGSAQNFEPLKHFASTKTVLSASQMCDALFGSTLSRTRIKILQENSEPKNVTNNILINLFRIFDQQQIKSLFQPEVYAAISGLWQESPQSYCSPHYHPLHNYYRMLLNERGRRGTLGGNISTNMFYRMQMLSYDNDVFDFGWNLPIAYREYQHVYRKSFTYLSPELSGIKRQGANLPISASNTRFALKNLENKVATLALKSPLAAVAKLYKPWNRPSYVSYNHWFREDLQTELIQFLTEEKLSSSELISQAAVKTLVYDHINHKRDNTAILWQVINIEHFYRNFMA